MSAIVTGTRVQVALVTQDPVDLPTTGPVVPQTGGLAVPAMLDQVARETTGLGVQPIQVQEALSIVDQAGQLMTGLAARLTAVQAVLATTGPVGPAIRDREATAGAVPPSAGKVRAPNSLRLVYWKP